MENEAYLQERDLIGESVDRLSQELEQKRAEVIQCTKQLEVSEREYVELIHSGKAHESEESLIAAQKVAGLREALAKAEDGYKETTKQLDRERLVQRQAGEVQGRAEMDDSLELVGEALAESGLTLERGDQTLVDLGEEEMGERETNQQTEHPMQYESYGATQKYAAQIEDELAALYEARARWQEKFASTEVSDERGLIAHIDKEIAAKTHERELLEQARRMNPEDIETTRTGLN